MQGASLVSPRHSGRNAAAAAAVQDSALSESSRFNSAEPLLMLSDAAVRSEGAEGTQNFSPCQPSARLGSLLWGGPSPLRRLPPRLEIPGGAHDDPQAIAHPPRTLTLAIVSLVDSALSNDLILPVTPYLASSEGVLATVGRSC